MVSGQIFRLFSICSAVGFCGGHIPELPLRGVGHTAEIALVRPVGAAAIEKPLTQATPQISLRRGLLSGLDY